MYVLCLQYIHEHGRGLAVLNSDIYIYIYLYMCMHECVIERMCMYSKSKQIILARSISYGIQKRETRKG